MSACSCSPAAKAAEAARTSWPPIEIQPVNHDAVARYDAGVRQWTQWYCPIDLSSERVKQSEENNKKEQQDLTSGGRIDCSNFTQ